MTIHLHRTVRASGFIRERKQAAAMRHFSKAEDRAMRARHMRGIVAWLRKYWPTLSHAELQQALGCNGSTLAKLWRQGDLLSWETLDRLEAAAGRIEGP